MQVVTAPKNQIFLILTNAISPYLLKFKQQLIIP